MFETIVAMTREDAVFSSPPGDEKHSQELLAPLPFHERLKKIDGPRHRRSSHLILIRKAGLLAGWAMNINGAMSR